jgi:hypothetical protein
MYNVAIGILVKKVMRGETLKVDVETLKVRKII